MALETRLAVLCFARSSRATRASRDEPSSKRVGGVGLSRQLPKLRSWRFTQPRATKATASVAVVGKLASITRATAVV